MFEVPAVKRVKRSEIFDHDIDAEADIQVNDASTEEITVLNYGFEYDFVDSNIQPTQSENMKEETFEFNLFRANPKAQLPPSSGESKLEARDTSAQHTSKSEPALISIRSPTPEPSGEAAEGRLSRSRPDAYYFTASTSYTTLNRLHQEYSKSAVSGENILNESKKSWGGMHLSWRVLHLPAHVKQFVEDRTAKAEDVHLKDAVNQIKTSTATSMRNTQRRARPSKKRRDLTRRKSAHRQAVIDETKTKEEHEKEKRNKKNRERKLKRRAKERKEKEEAKTSVVGTEASD